MLSGPHFKFNGQNYSASAHQSPKMSLSIMMNRMKIAHRFIPTSSVRCFASPSMQLIKDLRAQTSAPIADCKKALEASDGDMNKAFQWLRERGSAKASDLGKREAIEGLVGIASNDTDGAIIQVCCETDFSQRNDHFQKFVGDVVTAAFLRVPPPPGPGIHSISIDAMSEQSLFDDKVPLKL
jgi:hypothetical protein